MQRRLKTLSLLTLLALATLSISTPTRAQSTAATPPISGQVTFLYYEDVAAAAAFYRDVLGLENILDEGWVQFFAITPTSSVGLVDGARGHHRVSADKPVMLSIVTTDVEAWYARLLSLGVPMLKPLETTAGGGLVHAFLVQDPGGYTVEVFAWQ